MFGFLIRSEVNDDAVRLKMLVEQIVARYIPLNEGDLEKTIKADLPTQQYFRDRNYFTLLFPELDMFDFLLDTSRWEQVSDRAISVHGKGKYYGFVLFASTERWHCSVENGVAYRATGGAKKLAQVMEKKFNILNMSRLLNEFRR